MSRYDRQLRLWGLSGQKRLSSSKLLVLGCNPIIIETIKNLILPGCSTVYIVDAKPFSVDDLKSTFSISTSLISKNNNEIQYRCELIALALSNLNPEVQISYLPLSPDSLIYSSYVENISLFKSLISSCDLILTSLDDTSESSLVLLNQNTSVPLIHVQSCGLLAEIKIISSPNYPLFPVVNPHNQNHPDLRLFNPFDSLLSYLKSIELDDPHSIKDNNNNSIPLKGNVPFSIILLSISRSLFPDGLSKLSEANKSIAKDRVKSILNNLLKIRSEKLNLKEAYNGISELSLQEAYKNVHLLFNDSKKLSDELNSLLENPILNVDNYGNLFSSSTNFNSITYLSSHIGFWIMVRSLKQFSLLNGGELPLQGSIPDMHSDSDIYSRLRTLYVSKSEVEKTNFFILTIIEIIKELKEYMKKNSKHINFNIKPDTQKLIDNIHKSNYDLGRIVSDVNLKEYREILLLVGLDKDDVFEFVKQCRWIHAPAASLALLEDYQLSKYVKCNHKLDTHTKSLVMTDDQFNYTHSRAIRKVNSEINNKVNVNTLDLKISDSTNKLSPTDLKKRLEQSVYKKFIFFNSSISNLDDADSHCHLNENILGNKSSDSIHNATLPLISSPPEQGDISNSGIGENDEDEEDLKNRKFIRVINQQGSTSRVHSPVSIHESKDIHYNLIESNESEPHIKNNVKSLKRSSSGYPIEIPYESLSYNIEKNVYVTRYIEKLRNNIYSLLSGPNYNEYEKDIIDIKFDVQEDKEPMAYNPDDTRFSDDLVQDSESSMAHLSFNFMARKIFKDIYNRWPGDFKHVKDIATINELKELDNDVDNLFNIGNILFNIIKNNSLNELNLEDKVFWSRRISAEIVRSGNSKIHSVCSLIGGVIAQEAVKLLTQQYVPATGIILINGIRSSTFNFKI